jgi:FAD/FMN-containing dehydrogenase
MREILLSVDLWANILGGIVAAALVAGLAWVWDRRKHRILKELTGITGQAIRHRNAGEWKDYTDEEEWVRQAKVIEDKAIKAAKRLSSSAAALVEWLDRVEPHPDDDEVKKYIAILSKVVERIRELLERSSSWLHFCCLSRSAGGGIRTLLVLAFSSSMRSLCASGLSRS